MFIELRLIWLEDTLDAGFGMSELIKKLLGSAYARTARNSRIARLIEKTVFQYRY